MDVNTGDLDQRSEMLYRVRRLRLLVVATLVSFCIFFGVLLFPSDQIPPSDGDDIDPLEDMIKRTRVVQAVVGGFSYKYQGPVLNGDHRLPAKKLRVTLKNFQLKSNSFNLTKPSSTYSEDNYDDGDEIIADNDYDEDEDDYDDNVDNGAFEDGDFDYDLSLKANDSDILKVSESSTVTKIRNFDQVFRIKFVKNQKKNSAHPVHRSHARVLRNVSLINVDGVPIAEDHIFWSKELEEITPKGIDDEEMQKVIQKLRQLHVLKAQLPTWNRCGRPKNLFIVFEDGSKACARYRAPHQYLVQGEVLSFYLSRILGIWNVPAVALTDSGQVSRWNRDSVKSVLRKSEWEYNITVALIQWIDNLERDKMPASLMSAVVNKTVISGHDASLLKLSVKELVELLQWSDLILFDYVTGNYDRVASMQDAAEKEKKPSILNETIHNLVRSKSTGGLWLIDNESGLLDSYSLLYSRPGEDSRFVNFHRQMLKSVCLFRRTTIEQLMKLHWSNRAAEILINFVKENEPLFPPIKDYDILAQRLQSRIGEVYAHIKKCLSIFQ